MNSEYSPKNLLGVCCFLSWWREGDGNPAARFAVTFPINWNSCCKPSTDDGWLLGTQHHPAVSTKSADCHLPLILASRKRRLGWAYWVPSEVFFFNPRSILEFVHLADSPLGTFLFAIPVFEVWKSNEILASPLTSPTAKTLPGLQGTVRWWITRCLFSTTWGAKPLRAVANLDGAEGEAKIPLKILRWPRR